MTVTVWMIPFCIAFLIQNLVIFRFIGKIIDLKSESYRNADLVAFINCTLFTVLLLFFPNNSTFIYLFFILIYSLETCLLFKADIIVKLSCGLALPVHVVAIRNMIVYSYQILNTADTSDIIQSSVIYWNTLTLTSLLCSFAMLLLFHIISDDFFRMMNQSGSRMILFLAFMVTAAIRLALTGAVYRIDHYSAELAIQQIASGASWLMVVYTGVFMLIGFEMLNANREKLQNSLARESMYRNAMLNNSEMTLEVNCDEDRLIYVNINGISKDALVGEQYSDYISGNIQHTVFNMDKELVQKHLNIENLKKHYEHGDYEFNIDARVRKADSAYEWHNINVNIEVNDDLKCHVAIITYINIHDEKVNELDLKYKSERDPLVGAYNKSTVESLISEHIISGGIGVMLMIDLDNFKSINDNYGHSYGDKVLCEVNDKLNEIFRDNDIIGRVGGDEFLVYLKNVNETSIIVRRAEVVCKALNKTYYMNDKPSVTVSSSVGIALNPDDANSFKELFDKADVAMYAAKKCGKNNYKIYNASMQKN